jgi:hypothetical protein
MKLAFVWIRELKQQCSLRGEKISLRHGQHCHQCPLIWSRDPARFERAVLLPLEVISIHLPNVLGVNKQLQDGEVAGFHSHSLTVCIG